MYFFSIIIISAFLGLGCHKNATKVPQSQSEVKKPVVDEKQTVKETQKKSESGEDNTTKQVSLENVYFDFDRFDIRQDAREILARHAKILSENPKLRILIEGHCDERGTIEYNIALGEKRANAVKKYFTNYGLETNRFSVISYGKERPADARSTTEAWSKNRRAVFVLYN